MMQRIDSPEQQVLAQVPASASKKPWQSKTLWLGALTAVLPLVPGVGPVAYAWISANPELFSAAVGVVFTTLRLISDGKVSIS